MAIFLTILGAIVPYIPILLQVAGWAINFFGASKENLQQYQDMIQKNKDAGLITVDTYQKLSDWHQQMLVDLDKKQPDAAPKS